ncbi:MULTISPECIES: serine hydrolase [Lactobacillus]|uniref:Class A beta-lactamase-related serine hydrolase n=1 Tax=Lactobacillus xujianguonis TaxID=2495899 RepID=A0A437SWY7_9LACO|nr:MULTISPECIES: serine hydrolase domain-containing protein [Lactobacillus]RVU71434.1 class A beta-lactamase-related serine hydrolase [Lactobacillus xujianguonis]
MRHAIDRLNVKGSVLVIKHGKPWLNYATGNKADTSYLINSVQKSMTATMVMREVEKHHMKLNDPLSEYFADVPGAKEVKVKNLLNMTSGLNLAKGKELGTDPFISDKMNLASDIANTVFDEKQLGKWHYTAINYILLCGIISKLEHKSYEQLFRKTYIQPLKLKQTEFLWSSKAELKASHWLPGYEYRSELQRYRRFPHAKAVKDAHDELGAGSIVMSNHDLAKTMTAILHGKLLSEKSQAILFKGQAPTYYNGGFYNLPRFRAANGAGSGYYTFFRASDDGQNMLIIQSNHTKKGRFVHLRKKVNNIMSLILRFNKKGWKY